MIGFALMLCLIMRAQAQMSPACTSPLTLTESPGSIADNGPATNRYENNQVLARALSSFGYLELHRHPLTL